MNKLKIFIIIIIVIGIIISLVLFNIKKSEENVVKDNLANSIEEEIDQEPNTDDLIDEPHLEFISYNMYFTISNCVSQYLDTINQNNSSYYNRDGGKISNEEIQKMVKSQISTNYKSDIQMLNENNIFTPVKILRKTDGRVQTYVVYGVTANSDLVYINDVYFIVNLDIQNNTYSIEPLSQFVNNNGEDYETKLSNIEVTELESIEKNDYNSFTYQKVDKEFNYKKLFDNMKKLMLVKPEIAYEYLDEDYKAETFGSYSAFEGFVRKNREHLYGITPKSYDDNNENKMAIYDQYSNKYEFTILDTMKYSVRIGSYVSLSDEDLKEYNKLKDTDKVKYNIKRWVEMLNSKQYGNAYDCLDETFKQDNYETQEKFEEFIKSKYYDWYDEIKADVEKNGNSYIAKVELNSSKDEFSDKYMTIYMLLGDKAGFTMSFKAE